MEQETNNNEAVQTPAPVEPAPTPASVKPVPETAPAPTTPEQQKNQRPGFLTFVAVLGLIYAIIALIIVLLMLFSTSALINAEIPNADGGAIFKFIAGAVGLIAGALLFASILRITAAIGMLKMKKWGMKVFIVIFALTVITTGLSVYAQAGVWWNVAFLIIEAGILFYLYSIRARLK